MVFVQRFDHEIQTQVFVTFAPHIALVESEDLVVSLHCPALDGYHRLVIFVQFPVIRRVYQTVVVLVAWTPLWHLTSVHTLAKCSALLMLKELRNYLLCHYVHVDVLYIVTQMSDTYKP